MDLSLEHLSATALKLFSCNTKDGKYFLCHGLFITYTADLPQAEDMLGGKPGSLSFIIFMLDLFLEIECKNVQWEVTRT